mmetsp:Transcript_9910/g.27891  ORF Transcript_9910/g.27891 Transcript_9910/m.27891 type:complete len:95 (-) Transcript_9910:1414-1698(-)
MVALQDGPWAPCCNGRMWLWCLNRDGRCPVETRQGAWLRRRSYARASFSTSRADVPESTITSRGFRTSSARAIVTRCCCPRDKMLVQGHLSSRE